MRTDIKNHINNFILDHVTADYVNLVTLEEAIIEEFATPEITAVAEEEGRIVETDDIEDDLSYKIYTYVCEMFPQYMEEN